MAEEVITSRDNPRYKALKRLVQDPGAYRKHGQVWLEGEHLCQALVSKNRRAASLVCAESVHARLPARWLAAADQVVILADALFAPLSQLESPAQVAMTLALPSAGRPRPLPTVVLDRLQDAGNVGSILRSAAAFGFTQVLAMQGTAALWSPKVVRSAMGAHLSLHLVEGLDVAAVRGLGLPMVATSSHRGDWLHTRSLPWPCAWVMGHEGQGVRAELEACCDLQIRIAQPGGEESLNVAAAAAICLHASAARRHSG